MFSIVVCSHRPDRAAFVQAHYATLFRDHPHEFILIDDARSLCEGYTRGYERSRGDLLIFSHDDVEFVTPDLPSRLERHLARYDVVGIAGTSNLMDGLWITAGDPYCFMLVIYPEGEGLYSLRYVGAGPLCVPNLQGIDGCFIACRREVVSSCGFDAETFDSFHLYDLDFTFRAYLAGFRLAVCRDIALIYESLGDFGNVWQEYNGRFMSKFRAMLPPRVPGRYRMASVRLPREKLSAFCQPESIERTISWE